MFFMDEIAKFPRAYDSDAVTGKYALPDLYVSYQ